MSTRGRKKQYDANKDIREHGPYNYLQLQAANAAQLGNNPLGGVEAKMSSRPTDITNTPTGPMISGLLNISPEGEITDYWGNSVHDENRTTIGELPHVGDTRAENQPWLEQLGSGLVKGIVTAGTTFIDGTVGLLAGLGTGIANMFDDDPNTGFWRGMWDNAVSNAMADVNEKMEDVFKNYRTEWEQNASVFERMFGAGAANFWGDDILKNMGFTAGAAASILLTSGIGSALKGVGTVGKIGKGLGLLRNGAEGLEATKAGKVTSWLANTFISTQGEAAIEAVNGMRENMKDMELNINNRKEKLYQEAQANYEDDIRSGVDPETAKAAYDVTINAIDQDIEKYRKQMQSELQDAGNITYAANIAALSISNNLTLGSLIRGGYNTSKSLLESAIRTVDGKEVAKESTKEIAKGLLRGTLKFDAPALKGVAPKVAGRWLLQSSQEGIEEGVQNLANTTTQMSAQARMNKYARTDTMLGNMINPSAEEDLIDYSKALTKAYQDQFGAANSQGWTEVMAGFISGALGLPGVRRNEQGKLRPKMEGGIFEAIEAVTGKNKAIKRQLDLLNNALTENKYGERVRNAVTNLSIKQEQDEFLSEGDILNYKNDEIKQIVQDAISFRDLGMLDEYLGMYEALADDVTDDDIKELRAAVKQGIEGEITGLDKKTDEELKTIYSEKAKSTLNKVKETLNNYDSLDKQYGNRFSDETRRIAVQELTFKNTLLWDTYRRIDELEKENEEIQNKGKTTVIEDETIKNNKEAINSLMEQANELKKNLNEYKNDPKKLQKIVENALEDYRKSALYKKAEEAINKYKTASTYDDVMDVFYHSPLGDREAVLNQAIEQSTDDVKSLLTQFRDFIGDVNTLESLINDKYAPKGEDIKSLIKAARGNKVFKDILHKAAYELLHEENPTITRSRLKDKFVEKLQDWKQMLEEETAKTKGVTVNEEGQLVFDEALKNGDVSDSDFTEVLDNVETGETHTEIVKGSAADNIRDAITNVNILNDFIDSMNYFIKSMDKLDELRETAKKKEEKKEAKKKKEKKKDKKEEEDNNEDNDEDTYFDDDEDDDVKKEEEEEEEEENKGGKNNEDEDEDEETESKKLETKSPLSNEEKRYFTPVTIKDKQGNEYHSLKKIKDASKNKKVIESAGKKLDKADRQVSVLKSILNDPKESDENKIKALKNFLEKTRKNMLVGSEIIDEINDILDSYGYLLKSKEEKKNNKPSHSNKEGQNKEDNSVSLSGNQNPEYMTDDLSGDTAKMVLVTGKKKDNLQNWLREQHYDIQKVIDRYLNKIIERDKKKKVKDKTPVYYLCTSDREKDVFLGMKYSDVKDIIPRDEVKLVTTEHGEYVLIGTLGWEASEEGTKDMYDDILEETKDETLQDSSVKWKVNTKHTNRIKSITGGAKVKQTLKDNKFTIRSLRDLIKGEQERNPYNLEIEDLGWTIIEGKKEKPKFKHINVNDESKIYTVSNPTPGQVYMHIPASNGMYIPIYMEAVFLDELKDDTPLSNEINDIIETLSDPEISSEDKKEAIIELKDILVFSKVNNIYYNDENNKFDPNTIYIVRNGKRIKVLDLSEEDSNNSDKLLKAIQSINPRINISVSVLSTSPEIYYNSDVLRTDIAMLGTVNSKFYLYPTDDNNDYVENAVSTKANKASYTNGSVRERVYLQGKYVYFNGDHFEDEQHETIEDEDNLLMTAYEIKQGLHKPVRMMMKNNDEDAFFIVDDVVYADNGHGGLLIIEDESTIKKVKSAAKNGTKEEQRKKEVKKEVKKKEKTKEDEEVEVIEKGIAAIGEGLKEAFERDAAKIRAQDVIKYFEKNKDKYIDYLQNNDIASVEEFIDILLDSIDDDGVRKQWERDLSFSSVKKLLNSYIQEVNKDKAKRRKEEEKEQPTKKKKKHFTEANELDESDFDNNLEQSRLSSLLLPALSNRSNEDKVDTIYDLVETKLGVKANTDNDLIKALVDNKIDVTSDDLDTLINILENCR